MITRNADSLLQDIYLRYEIDANVPREKLVMLGYGILRMFVQYEHRYEQTKPPCDWWLANYYYTKRTLNPSTLLLCLYSLRKAFSYFSRLHGSARCCNGHHRFDRKRAFLDSR